MTGRCASVAVAVVYVHLGNAVNEADFKAQSPQELVENGRVVKPLHDSKGKRNIYIYIYIASKIFEVGLKDNISGNKTIKTNRFQYLGFICTAFLLYMRPSGAASSYSG